MRRLIFIAMIMAVAAGGFCQVPITGPKPNTTEIKKKKEDEARRREAEAKRRRQAEERKKKQEEEERIKRQEKDSLRRVEEERLRREAEEARRLEVGFINDHDYVDLGLPSKLKWATCNVGASSPAEYGDYYAWGETEVKERYDQANSQTYDIPISQLRTDCVVDSLKRLTLPYDAARTHWGGSWRMPTDKEFEELMDNCTWEWTTEDGSNGYKVTGKNGRCIFLPATGKRNGMSCDHEGTEGNYWTSTPFKTSTLFFHFDSGRRDRVYSGRNFGRPVRPVSE